jgi:hypothetical protein
MQHFYLYAFVAQRARVNLRMRADVTGPPPLSED